MGSIIRNLMTVASQEQETHCNEGWVQREKMSRISKG